MNIYNVGEPIFLYAKFENDLQNVSFINEPYVTILYIKDGQNIELLNTKMQTTNFVEYYYNFTIPLNADLGLYQVIYSGFVNGQQNKMFESFYVVNSSSDINPIRVFGYIYDNKTHKYLTDVEVEIRNNDIIYHTLNNLIGQWECYLYSGEYKFIFKKTGYKPQEVIAKINDTLQEVEFNNVIMEEVTDFILGDGLYEITDQYTLKDGQPIENINIEIYNVNDLNTMLVKTQTNDDGFWTAYLNEGLYLLKVYGNFSNREYNKSFRLKVKNNGTYVFEDISNNMSSENSVFYSNGNGRCKYIDYIYDKKHRPLADVQVNILKGNDILYQYYTDVNGRFEFNLNEGEYNFEFYHPSFKTINQKIKITQDYEGKQLEV